MKAWKACALIISLAICAIAGGQTSATKVTVTGTLTRGMAIGGESTGWTIQLWSGNGRSRDSGSHFHQGTDEARSSALRRSKVERHQNLVIILATVL
jgi:hypothetical protein